MAVDQFIIEFDRALRTVFVRASSVRPTPGDDASGESLNEAERRHVVGLMRINHCGEVCAQALYHGQALTACDPAIRDALRGAAHEETEHLAWTERRIADLGGRRSLLNLVWYAGALATGIAAGRLGDRWSLGFLAETERQVEAHLDEHLRALPESDTRSWAILNQMRLDEIEHAETAVRLGAAELPGVAKCLMRWAAKLMTRTAYRI